LVFEKDIVKRPDIHQPTRTTLRMADHFHDHLSGLADFLSTLQLSAGELLRAASSSSDESPDSHTSAFAAPCTSKTSASTAGATPPNVQLLERARAPTPLQQKKRVRWVDEPQARREVVEREKSLL
jgi:hypothetical protein